MSMSEDEKQIMVLTIRQAVSDSMAPIMTRVGALEVDSAKHEQTIYGPNHDNGLVGDNKKLKEQMGEMRAFKAQVVALAGAAGTFAGLASAWVKSLMQGR
jgi:hypothetical protein